MFGWFSFSRGIARRWTFFLFLKMCSSLIFSRFCHISSIIFCWLGSFFIFNVFVLFHFINLLYKIFKCESFSLIFCPQLFWKNTFLYKFIGILNKSSSRNIILSCNVSSHRRRPTIFILWFCHPVSKLFDHFLKPSWVSHLINFSHDFSIPSHFTDLFIKFFFFTQSWLSTIF